MYREFELPSNRSRQALAVLLAVTVLLTMALGRPPVTSAATLAADSFTRVVANGWGNLTSGQAWLITNGNEALTDVNGSVGQMTHAGTVPADAKELKARVPTFNAVNVTVSAKFRAETLANDAPTSNTEFTLYSRYDAEPDFCCYYKLTLAFIVGAASPVLRADKQNGSFTPGIGNANLPATNNNPTVAWNLKLETVGNAVRGKAWLASTSEPAGWQIDIIDSTNPVTGVGQDNQFVVGTFTNDFTPTMVIDVDDVLVTTGSTDTTPPTIIARSPSPNATGVNVSTNITAQFSEAVTGVSTGNFAISNVSNFVNLPATVSYNAATRTATLNPNSNLTAGATYRVALSGSIKDTAGNSLAWTTWNFTTAQSSTTFNPPAPVTFKKGTHTGYQFNASGAVTAIKTFTLANNSGAYTTKRQGITNQSGQWLTISSGIWAGYQVRQSSAVYVTATPIPDPPGANATFSPAKSLTFLKGTHTGYQFSGTGAMTAQKTFTLANNSAALTTQRSTRTNQSGKWFLVSSGVWAGYWVRSSDVVFLP